KDHVGRSLSLWHVTAQGEFFFQAEDGIRARNVTGVQTCALPICEPAAVVETPRARLGVVGIEANGVGRPLFCDGTGIVEREASRSEERRVGKECRAGGLAAD